MAETDVAQDTTPAPQADQTGDGAATWAAMEFIAHQKTAGWYGLLMIAALGAAGLIYMLTRDIISSSVVIVGGVVLGVYAARKPREVQYRVDSGGVTVGSKFHTYEEFRSFAIVPEGAAQSIIFAPLQRFAPLTTIYYPPEHENKIVDILADHLPFTEHNHDAVDRLMRRIHF